MNPLLSGWNVEESRVLDLHIIEVWQGEKHSSTYYSASGSSRLEAHSRMLAVMLGVSL